MNNSQTLLLEMLLSVVLHPVLSYVNIMEVWLGSRNMFEVILLSISSMLLRDWIPVGFMSNGVYHDVENYYTCDRHNVTSDYEKSLLSLQ